MKAAAFAPIVAWLVAVGAVAAIDSYQAAALTGALLLLVALLSALAVRAAGRGGTQHTVERQTTVAIALPIAQMVLAAALFAAVMFLSAHDAVLILLVSTFAATLGILTGRTVTRRLAADVRGVRDGLVEVGAGRRDLTLAASGSSELADLATAANAMAAQLAAEERARRTLVAAISHDLRTPLTSLRLVTEALGDEMFDADEHRRYVERLRVNITALQALIEDLFELSRLEAGEVTWSLGPVDVRELVDETIDAMHAGARAKQVRLLCDIPPGLARVQANPEKLQRVLFNLLQNAIRHTRPGSTVTVVAADAPSHVDVEVTDEGPGIPQAERATVFDAFVQAGDRAARTGGGAGLGLAIARAIVVAHGGRIDVLDAAQGARVRFRLPVAKEAAVAGSS